MMHYINLCFTYLLTEATFGLFYTDLYCCIWNSGNSRNKGTSLLEFSPEL